MGIDNVTIFRIFIVITVCLFVEGRRVKRVVGGTEVTCGTQIQVASLRNSTTLQHVCGAVILTPDFALTAAHCVTSSTSQYILQLNNYCEEPLPKAKLLEIVTHHLYDRVSRAHDIAILRIRLYPQAGDITSGWLRDMLPNSSFGTSGACEIFGYGSHEPGSEVVSDVLLAADVMIVSLDYCTETLGPIAPEHDSGMMCAMGEGTDACQGDSGSPLICDSFVQGIVSYGMSCAVDNMPGVYTSIGAHLRWIRSVIGT